MFQKNIKLLKSKALELLYAGQNHIQFVLALIIAATFCVIPIVICFLASELLDETVLTVLLFVMEIFVAFPLFSGIYCMVGNASRNKEYGLIDIFFAFSSIKNYFRVIFMNLICFLKYVTPLSIGFIMYTVAVEILGSFNVPHELALSVGWILIIVSIVLLLPLCSRFYAVRFLVTVEDLGVIKAVKRSWQITKRNALKLIFLNISLLPLAILSVVALLVPFVVYTFPFLMCVYSVTCGKLLRADETAKIIIVSQNDICSEGNSEDVEEINEQDS
jgi:hypothetical protein